MTNNTKVCKDCKLEKDTFLFYANKLNLDGLGSYCKPCAKIRSAKWKSNNKEKHLLQSINWRAANPEQKKITDNLWRNNNLEKVRESNRRWQEKNPEKILENIHIRKARKQNNKTYFVRKKFIVRLYNSSCVFCGSKEKIQMDHVMPISRGGQHSEGNLQPLCQKCNYSKNSKTMSEWRYSVIRRKGKND